MKHDCPIVPVDVFSRMLRWNIALRTPSASTGRDNSSHFGLGVERTRWNGSRRYSIRVYKTCISDMDDDRLFLEDTKLT